jgi:hypothetical protein
VCRYRRYDKSSIHFKFCFEIQLVSLRQGPMPAFREGPFRLALHSLGVYASDTAAAAAAVGRCKSNPVHT